MDIEVVVGVAVRGFVASPATCGSSLRGPYDLELSWSHCELSVGPCWANFGQSGSDCGAPLEQCWATLAPIASQRLLLSLFDIWGVHVGAGFGRRA